MLGGAVNPIATRHLLDSGASVVINGAHRYHNPLALFCRSIEKSFSHPVQANAYFTPPHSQAFKTHFDDHDVFVLQVSGSKHWRLYDRPIINPMPGQAFDPVKDTVGRLSMEVNLCSGDLLYLPRGLLHEASATAEHSLHLTVGILAYTWVEFVLEAIAEVALRENQLRGALPPGMLVSDRPVLQSREMFVDVLTSSVRRIDFDAVFALFRERFALSRFPIEPEVFVLNDDFSISAADFVRVRDDAIWATALESDDYCVMAHGRRIRFSAEQQSTVDALLNISKPRRISDSEADESSALAVAKALIQHGILVRVVGGQITDAAT